MTVNNALDLINIWLQYLGFDNPIQVNEYKSRNSEVMPNQFALENIFLINGHRIEEQGHGVRQLLPILVSLIDKFFKPHTIFMWEQPEVHLHPKIMTRLPKLINAFSGHATIIAETHSYEFIESFGLEHYQNKKTNNERLSMPDILYFSMKGKKTSCEPAAIQTENGLPLFVPEGFVDKEAMQAREEMRNELIKEGIDAQSHHQILDQILREDEKDYGDCKIDWLNSVDQEIFDNMGIDQKDIDDKLKISKKDKHFFMISKYISSFLNRREGGRIFIGVEDVQNGFLIRGIDKDYRGVDIEKQQWESFTNNLPEQIIGSGIITNGERAPLSDEIKCERIIRKDKNGEDQNILVIHCRPTLPHDGFWVRPFDHNLRNKSKYEDGSQFLVRRGAASKRLTRSDVFGYIRRYLNP